MSVYEYFTTTSSRSIRRWPLKLVTHCVTFAGKEKEELQLIFYQMCERSRFAIFSAVALDSINEKIKTFLFCLLLGISNERRKERKSGKTALVLIQFHRQPALPPIKSIKLCFYCREAHEKFYVECGKFFSSSSRGSSCEKFPSNISPQFAEIWNSLIKIKGFYEMNIVQSASLHIRRWVEAFP